MDERRLGPLLLAVALLLVAPRARAADSCSVVRKCSATGIACMSGDRKCEDEARARGLEVVCDVLLPDAPDQKQFVWCPPVTDVRDSKIVWLLLSVAITLAVGGGVIAYTVLRKKPEA